MLLPKRASYANRLFEDQFEPAEGGGADKGGFVYRRSMKGAPIAVTAAEKEAFIASYRRRMRLLPLVGAGGMMAVIFGIVFLLPGVDMEHNKVLTWSLVLPFIVAVFVFQRWFWDAPMRALAARAPVGPPLAPAEITKRRMAQIGYGQLAILPIFVGYMLWKLSARLHPGPGWEHLWILPALALAALSLVQALRKWSSQS